MMVPRISVCIPTVRATTLGEAIASVRLQSFGDWDLLVVGQGDEVTLRAATLRAACDDTRVSYLHLRRFGLSAARNVGMQSTAGDIIAFMDDDCEADREWLSRLDAGFRDDVGFVCGSVEAPSRAGRWFAVCPRIAPADVMYSPTDRDAAWPPGFGLLGANMAIRRCDAERVGGFDECLGIGSAFGGGEEHDYVSRLARLGVRMRSTPDARVRHTHGYRYGARAVYLHRRDRVRGDGALAAKRTLLAGGVEPRAVGRSVYAEAKGQLSTINAVRLPQNAFRLFHYLTSYKECLTGYELADGAHGDPASAVLQPRCQPRTGLRVGRRPQTSTLCDSVTR
jgi:glycosyltransferase involved in cell wall biosynthesis